MRIEIANCPPYFLVRLFNGRHIGLWILHTMLLTLLILNEKLLALRSTASANGELTSVTFVGQESLGALGPLVDS